MKTRTPKSRSTQQKRRNFLSPKATEAARFRNRRLHVESLEDRRVLATFYVDSTPTLVGPGNDTFTASGGSQVTTGGLTLNTNLFTTIQAAVDAAGPTDTINVANGTYSELVTVNESVTLRGNQFGVDARTRGAVSESVVNGALVGLNRTTAFNITASGATVDGFTSRDQTDPSLNAGIVMASTTANVTVRNNIITNNVIGIYANSTGASLIERNLLDGNNSPGSSGGAGIYSEITSGLTIDNNEIRNHTLNNPIIFGAVSPVGHTNLTVSNNSIHDNVNGIFALSISGGVFSGNTITTGGTATALTFGGSNTGIDVLNNDLSGNQRGLRIADFGYFGATPNSDIEAHFNNFANNSIYGAGITSDGGTLTDGYTGPLDVTGNWWGNLTGPTSAANPGGAGTALVNDFADSIDFQPWLLYGDANPAAVGFQIPTAFAVPAQVGGFTSTNNNYRRLVNAIDLLQPGQTASLSGVFDWTEANAAASWALGNDGVASTADDYSLLVRPNLSNVTITAAALGAATIQGPGDVAAVNLEGVFVFDGGDNQNWTISNLQILDFDLSIAMFNGAGGVDAFNGTQIVNNRIRVPADWNVSVAPLDVNQNIGIHFSFGTNQSISGNQIELIGSGLSNSGAAQFSSSVGMQSNTSGGSTYDNLVINGNVLTVTGAQAADPASIIGIWENAHGHTSDITVSNNQILNQTTGGTPANNLIRGFRVTSHSGLASTVAYTGNTVQGANIGFQWIAGSNFVGNQAVRLWQNTLTNNDTGVLVQSGGIANLFQNTITGSGTAGVDVQSGSLTGSGPVSRAVEQNFISGGSGDGLRIAAGAGPIGTVFNNDLSGNAGFGLNNGSAASILAEFNWWGSNTPAGVAAEVNGPADVDPWLTIGTDIAPATPGFQGNLNIFTSGTETTFIGTPGNDTLTINATSDNDASFILVTPGGTFTGSLVDATRIQFDALAGNDLLIINNPVSGIFAPSTGIFYNGGGQAGDALQNLGGTSTSGFYSPGPTNDAGILSHTGGGFTQTITFTGLAPIDDTVATLDFTINGTAAANTINVTTGPVVGVQTVTVAIDAFEPINFANKTNVDISGQGGGDTTNLNIGLNAAGLATLDLYGHNATAAGDDNLGDTVNLAAYPAAISVLAAGQGGTDYVNNLGTGNLDLLAGPLTIDGGETPADADVARLHDFADAGPDTVVFDRTSPTVGTIAGAAGGLITYTNLEVMLFEGTAGGDTINVLATLAGTNYLVTGNGGGDTITLGNQTADFGGTFDGSLDNIQGDILLTGEFNPAGPGSIDTINVDDSGTAAANVASIGIAPFDFILPAIAPGGTDSGPATVLAGFAPATIRYRHTDSTFVPAAFNNRVENLNILSGSGDDVIAVGATTATIATTLNTREGNDAVTIQGDNLSAANTFSGFTGNDEFTLNIAGDIGGSAFAPITSLQINGNDPAGDSENRDRLTINDNSAASRFLNYQYLSQTSGDLDIEPASVGDGLFGAADLDLQVRTIETVIFNSAGTNDFVNVTGTADNDLLTVGLVADQTAALVFLGGAPYLDVPPVSVAGSLPGVAGGGSGPDLFINGMVPGGGIFLSGGGIPAGGGDRAVVYAASEDDLVSGGALDIFGFGPGVLIPGFGAGNAYDEIFVDDSSVFTTNNSAGPLATVFLDTASFVQDTPPSPTQQAALIVNGGDEAVAGPGGVADDISATISSDFNIQVNGNLPGLVVGPGGEPQGDALEVFVPGAANVFSDAASPPNVTISSTVAGPFGITFSSIERATFTPTSGIVNIIGDNNDPAADQDDLFIVRGQDVEFDPLVNAEGVNEFSLQISGDKAGGPAALSSPIFFNGVTRINASGGEATGFDASGNAIPEVNNTLVDTLDITPYADNTPRGWGIETYFNEGDPILDGDLLIYNGVLGVSETIVVQPSASQAGQVFANNAATGTPIAVINYVLNTNLIVNGSSPAGTAGDTDSLTLRGTDPANPGTSGSDTFDIDFTNTGLPGSELVVVTDTVGGAALYSLQNFSNFDTLNFETLGGADTLLVTNRPGLTLNVDGGNPVAGLPVGINTTSDTLAFRAAADATISQGADPTSGVITQPTDGPISYRNIELLVATSIAAASTLTINGTDANDEFSLQEGGGLVEGLVTLNAGPQIAVNPLFDADPENFDTIVLNGQAGSDTFDVTPVAGIDLEINGGPSTASDKVIITGTSGTDTFNVEINAADDATVVVNGGATINVNTTESLVIDGNSSANNTSDTLFYQGIAGGDNRIVFTPGLTPDAGTITGFDFFGAQPAHLPLAFEGLGSDGGINIDSNSGAGFDVLVIQGTDGSDSVEVSGPAGDIRLITPAAGPHALITTNAFNALLIEGSAGNDTFDVLGGVLVYQSITIRGGDPTAGDTLNYFGDGGDITVDLGNQFIIETGLSPVSFFGIEHVNVAAAGAAVSVLGSDANDQITVSHDAGQVTQFQQAGSNAVVRVSDLGASALTLDTLGGVDSATVLGTAAVDTVAVTYGPTTIVAAGLQQPLSIISGSLENLTLSTGAGNDSITLVGNATITTLVDAGDPVLSDTVTYTVATDATVTQAATSTAGKIAVTGASDVDYIGVEVLSMNSQSTVGATLTIQGTHDNDTIAVGIAGPVVNNFTAAWINDGTVVRYNQNSAAFGNVVVQGRFGSDSFSVTPHAGVNITIQGGDPTASDTVVVNGTTGLDAINVTSTADNAATVQVNALGLVTLVTVEHLTINGLGGNDDLTITTPDLPGGDIITLTPGVDPDSGSVDIHAQGLDVVLLPLEYRNLGDSGSLVLADGPAGARRDVLVLRGTQSDDFIGITSTQVSRFGSIDVLTGGILAMTAEGLGGNDTFDLTGTAVYAGGVSIVGGDDGHTLGDLVQLNGDDTLIQVNRSATPPVQVLGGGLGNVQLQGVENVDLRNPDGDIEFRSFNGPSLYQVTPLTASEVLIKTGDGGPVYTVFSRGDLTIVDGIAADGDVLEVHASPEAETITVIPGSVQISGLKEILFSEAFVESLRVFGHEGNDAFTVTPMAAVPIFIDGGDPIGTIPGDSLTVAGAMAFFAGPESDEGGFLTDGETVSFDHIESLIVAPSGDCPFLILGTNGDDDITVIARDTSYAIFDSIATLGAIVPGAGYVDGIYANVALTGGTGTGATADITVVGGLVTAVTLVSSGRDYTVGDVLSAATADLGGAGSGFSITVASIANAAPAGLDGIQDYTVSVNAGPDILFIDQPDLYIDALSGDDDIVIRAPAPNDADWNVNVRVAGGPPSIGEPNEGDRLVLETPGTDSLFFTPTGADTGSLLLDAGGAVGVFDGTDTIITFAPFVFECDDPVGGAIEFTYISSQGGVELVEYDGEDTANQPAGGAVVDPADSITIGGTAGDDTTTVAPQDLGSGTFVSSFSPLFVFRSFQALTVNPGTGGFDHVVLSGTEGPDTITSDATTLTLAGVLIHTVTLGAGLDQLTVNTFGGNDSIDLDLQLAGLAKTIDAGAGNDTVNLLGVLVDPADPVILGGLGDDILIGSPNPDQIFGGAGNDTINGGGGIDYVDGETGRDSLTGGAGNDEMLGGDDADVFVWSEGDGNDIVEGGGGEDIAIVNTDPIGSDELFLLTDASTRVKLERINFSDFELSIGSVEQIDVNSLGGSDDVTVGDLSVTEVKMVNVNVGGGGLNSVEVHGTPVSDQITVNNTFTDPAEITGANIPYVNVSGLAYHVNVFGTIRLADDILVIRAGDGNDTILAPGPATLLRLNLLGGSHDDFISGNADVLNGELGNDTLVGGTVSGPGFPPRLFGGDGDDLIIGGNGNDLIFGENGEDTIQGRQGLDTIDGGGDFDTILVRGTAGPDTIGVNQIDGVTLTVTTNGIADTDTLVNGGIGERTVERVRVESGSGDDIVLLRHGDSLGVDGLNNELLFDADGGSAQTRDRLSVQDDVAAPGLGDLLLYRKGENDSAGSITVGPGNINPLENVFENFEFIQPLTNAAGQVVVFKHDPFEWNDDRINATHLGAGDTINVDPNIDPGPLNPGVDGFDPLPGDQDFYRIIADKTGTLDIQVYFSAIVTVPSGRPGLPGGGNLDLQLFDADGTLIVDGVAGGIVPEFGLNDTDDNERIRIPAVEGQTYFLRVFGAGVAINNYNVTVVNTPAPVSFDLELDDVIAVGTAQAGSTATTLVGNATLSAVPNFYTGKDVVFTSGPLNGQRGRVTAYNGPARTFTFAANTFTGAPVAGNTFQIESVDTGRSQLDNITRDSTPTIFLRLADSGLLLDIPENGTAGEPGLPPDGAIIPIPFQPSTAVNSPAPGFRVAIIHVENNTHTIVGYAQPVAGSPGLYSFTFGAALADGSHFISARVEMIDPANPEQAQGLGGLAQSLEIVVDTQIPPVFFGLPGVLGDGLLPGSDSGVNPNQETLADGVTSDTTPGFFGQAEADAVIRLFIDFNDNEIFEPAIDFQVGFDVAEPLDGTNQYPTGYWQIDSINVNLNSDIFPLDGVRRFFVTAEDVAGNINNNPFVAEVNVIEIFLDTQGPQITDVTINADNDPYNLFDPKPSTDGPTPLVNSIWIDIQDLPDRDLPDFDLPAFKQDIAENPGHYLLQGDHTGIVPILDVNAFFDAPIDGQPARGRVQLVFRTEGLDGAFNTSDDIGSALPDDRFTLTVSEDGIIDRAGNKLDGESNADEPHDSPGTGLPPVLGVDGVPTGDGLPGGDFVARFTVDTRPELGVWAAGSAFLDINGNTIWDPDNADSTNRDIAHVMGFTSDDLFAGNFAPSVNRPGTPDDDRIADGFDKLGAYGRVGTTTFRWLIDTDNDGVSDVEVFDPRNINGLPVAGRFDGNNGNGDEVGLFTGNTWWFDINHDFRVDVSVAWPVSGHAIVGDFDGDGLDDLGTWSNDTFSFDLSSIDTDGNAADNVLPGIDGTIDDSFRFGFIGPGERPVAADMNQDGIEDVGLWVPARDGITPRGQAEWYFLVSGVTQNDSAALPDRVGPTVTATGDGTPGSYAALPNAFYGLSSYADGRVVTDPLVAGQSIVRFQPVPFGNDQYLQFGDEFALPLVGNFDPPVSPSGSEFTNPRDGNDVNNDGNINVLDLMAIVNYLTENGSGDVPTGGFVSAPFCDVNADARVNVLDLMAVVNHITAQYAVQSGGDSEGEGEGPDAFFGELGAGSSDGDDGDDDLLGLLAQDR